jgi:hypothetical protein
MDFSENDQAANLAATFHPASLEPDGETWALPCIEIGGVQVYAYLRDGILVVSVDLDEAGTGQGSPFALPALDPYGIPVVITVTGAGAGPVWDSLPADALTENDARQLRETDDARPGDWVMPDWVEGA